ncbi:MAG: hypothetical protein M1816_003040 [Peltula sp. TS41687]|nr:MAG: hypothetical protein M1816_003040 [Peltula sp. TS41687]
MSSDEQPSDVPIVPSTTMGTTEQKQPAAEPKVNESGGGGVLGALSSGVSTAGNAVGTAAGGILNTAGDTFSAATKGTGDTIQKTIGAVTGENGGAGAGAADHGKGK